MRLLQVHHGSLPFASWAGRYKYPKHELQQFEKDEDFIEGFQEGRAVVSVTSTNLKSLIMTPQHAGPASASVLRLNPDP